MDSSATNYQGKTGRSIKFKLWKSFHTHLFLMKKMIFLMK